MMFDNVWTKLSESIASQVWFQELKTKWDQLDSAQQSMAKIGGVITGVLAVIGVLVSFGLSAHGLKQDLKNKRELLKLLSQMSEESKPSSTESEASAQTLQWKKEIESITSRLMINTSQIEWKDEKRIASQNPAQLETWLEFKLNDIELRQLVKLSVAIETHQPPLKVRALNVDSSRSKGKVLATFSVSGFEVKP